MTTITTRAGLGSPLSNDQVDANFTNLNDDKVEASGDSMTGDLSFGDNNKVILGSGSDLQLYHDPSVGSIIQEAGAGSLFVRASTNIQLEGVNGENMAIFNENGSVQLYYDNAEKLATTSTGVDVTGNLTVDAGSNGKIDFGNVTTNYGRLYADSTGTFVGSVTADPLIFRTTNTERMRIDSSGRVGIGESNPATDLHITNSGSTQLLLESGSSSQGILLFGDASDLNIGSVVYDHSNNSMTFETDDTVRMTINSSGKVGIGVTSPSGRVHADGDAYTAFIADGTSGGAFKFYKNGSQHAQIFSDGSGDIIFRNNSDSERMRIDSSGRLGLGTSSPAQKLTVVESSADFAALIKNDLTSGNGLRIQAGDNSGDRILQLEDKDANEKFRVTALGNVGINNTNPQAPLHANGDSAFGEAAIFQNNGDATSWARADWINDQASGTGIVYRDQAGTFVFRNDNSSGTAMNTQIVAGGSTAGNIVFRKDSTGTGEIAKFDASGNLLVGKTDNDNTTAGFKVQSGGFFSAVADGTTTCVLNRLTSDGDIAIFRKDGTTVGSIGAAVGNAYYAGTATGITFGSANLYPTNASGTKTDGVLDLGSSGNRFKDLHLSGSAYLDIVRGHDDTNTYIRFIDSDRTQFVQGGAESMRIDAGGNLLVNTTGATSNNNDGFTAEPYAGGMKINVGHNGSAANGDVYVGFRRNGTFLGSITQVSSTGVAYNTTSDERLKENIVDAPSASDDIDAIQVRSFDWKADGSHQKYGMVAQELQSVAPEAVTEGETEDDMMSVDYSKLVPMLVKEIQSLRARVAQLEGAN